MEVGLQQQLMTLAGWPESTLSQCCCLITPALFTTYISAPMDHSSDYCQCITGSVDDQCYSGKMTVETSDLTDVSPMDRAPESSDVTALCDVF